jgi:hypothetical protein
MLRKLARLVALSSLLVTATVTLAPTVLADSRCGGTPGIQTWENTGLSGRTVIWCTDDHRQIRVSDLTTHHENLFPFESWNDRISSVQTFNFPAGFAGCLYENVNYNPNGGDMLKVIGNQTKTTIGTMNDRASSIKYTC